MGLKFLLKKIINKNKVSVATDYLYNKPFIKK